ncbi:hypothetical protein MTR_2g090800 [Medicago truncatula]|nr:hypothetical protein MTR_2g090800 [Medicago truncatula]
MDSLSKKKRTAMNLLADSACDVKDIEDAIAKANAKAKPSANVKAKPAAKAKPSAKYKGKAIQEEVPEWDDTTNALLTKAVKRHGKSHRSFINIVADPDFEDLLAFGSDACRLKWGRIEKQKEKLMKDAQAKAAEKKSDELVKDRKGRQLKVTEEKEGPEESDSELGMELKKKPMKDAQAMAEKKSDGLVKDRKGRQLKVTEEKEGPEESDSQVGMELKKKPMKDAQAKAEEKSDGLVKDRKGRQLKVTEEKEGPEESVSQVGDNSPSVKDYFALVLTGINTVIKELKVNNSSIKETNSTLKELVTVMNKKP